MANVKVLVVGDDIVNLGQKGDILSVVRHQQDWGLATVSPEWVRLTITNVPGAQEVAEGRIARYMADWRKAFECSLVDGAAEGKQRYRVAASEGVAANFDMNTKTALRDEILNAFDGTLVGQTKSQFEFEGASGVPLDEVSNVIAWETFRRFAFPESMVDSAIGSVEPGQPAEFKRTFNWVKANVIDKLRV